MTIKRIARTIVISGAATMSLVGVAFADDATISNTGPSSTNLVTINNTSTVVETNTNNLTVTNSNDQSGSTGSTSVAGNTSGGSATSGSVTNTNTTSTTLGATNSSIGSGGGTGSGGGAGSGGGGVGGGSVSTSGAGSGGAGVLTLPEVGCSTVCDVSALRAAYDAAGTAAQLQQKASGPVGWLSLMALVLSLIGAAGATAYSARQQMLA